MVVFASLSALKYYLVFLLIIIIIPLVTSLSFNFDSFNPNDQNVTYEEDAFSANGVIQLTKNQLDRGSGVSIGRATYFKTLHLWDKASGNLTDFTTHFSFSINSQGRTAYGDGLAFFLAPAGSRIPENTTIGGSLGLTIDTQQLNTSNNHFVAVEFDTFNNWYDPQGDHVGIDINSMQSVVNLTWFSSIPNGNRTDAWISYNSTSKNLTVVFTGFRANSTVTVQQSLSHNLDLREYLPEWVTFGFTGATGDLFALQSISSWNFTSSLEINDNITDPGVALPIPKPEETPSKSKLRLVIGLVSGGCVLVAVSVLVLFVFWRKRKLREDEDDDDSFDGSMADEFERSTGPKKFLYSELARCTNNFAQEEKLGEGGFGGVYKGHLRESNSYVAVKRVSRGSRQGIKEFASEVRIISRLRHRHLVQLIGWCHEKRELLLVYEFMPNGSLDFHLFKGKSHLTWPIRYKIAQGLASALLYLHEEWEQCVVHRDIKSSNIMLDSNFNAKLGDFGLARLVDHEKGSQTTVLAGTMGYMAPECATTGKASKETDVYSFGIVALEIACGRRPIDRKAESDRQVNIVEWVWSLYGMGNINESADPKLSLEFNEMEMKHLLIVGLWCAHPDSNCRPSIRQAIHVLNFEAPLPTLPPNMPVPTYCSPSQHLSSASFSSPYDTNASRITEIQYSVNKDYTDSSNNTAASAASSPSASLLYSPNGAIQLATYSKPLHLWDKASGNVTDFTTHFSFSINSQGRTSYGDGLAFFLAPAGSRILYDSAGDNLGLSTISQQLNTSNNHFVAVEFDTFQNVEYNPMDDHVGINIKSMQSVINVTWFSSIPAGKRTDVWIKYNSTSENLTVVFTGFKDNSTVTVMQSLSYNHDPREYLPEWVIFGFTGATGDFFALKSIYSWIFSASLEDNDSCRSMARLVDHEKGFQTTVLAGTMGYMAPECHITSKASKETDVYSFGVVALEIASGRKPIDPTAEDHQVNIVNWVWRLYGVGNLHEAVDPKLSSEFNEPDMEHLLIVGLCYVLRMDRNKGQVWSKSGSKTNTCNLGLSVPAVYFISYQAKRRKSAPLIG
ncbi:l-type lectin-domain containing receptor kinase ix.1 [Nicotiana attenuata]|uniref:non-specific serine/threonine protein kinase n=1 Tax=Nicotiana attenuata TaxID=49451 RepID=A0A1J6I702_NICAT|nr:l-type lectin-domain containing receptor kinase ix.1 [Nicotiana attenuata]OIT27166.1 l-type lectin-domain containing receptor kinase ix.1 [Nicotiana attenuata]